MLKKSLTSPDTIEFPLFTKWNENLLDIVVIFTALITLVTTWIYSHCRKMKYDKTLAVIIGLIYGVFLVAATIIACKKAYF